MYVVLEFLTIVALVFVLGALLFAALVVFMFLGEAVNTLFWAASRVKPQILLLRAILKNSWEKGALAESRERLRPAARGLALYTPRFRIAPYDGFRTESVRQGSAYRVTGKEDARRTCRTRASEVRSLFPRRVGSRTRQDLTKKGCLAPTRRSEAEAKAGQAAAAECP